MMLETTQILGGSSLSITTLQVTRKYRISAAQIGILAALNSVPVYWKSPVSTICFASEDIGEAHADSSSAVPLLFVLSSGADPMSKLLALSEKVSIPLKAISLGQGQGPHAQKLIAEGAEKGFWVLLQNCHLSVSWMPVSKLWCTRPT